MSAGRNEIFAVRISSLIYITLIINIAHLANKDLSRNELLRAAEQENYIPT
jgi:hypothetical protein